MVLPMLKIVYWQNSLPAHQQTAINLATLVGTIIGQLTFGILADRYGRKRMYGYELIIVIVATVGLALCSKGAQSSVNILAWVISWRLLMGIGIGADYPLSAVIVSEYVVIVTLWLNPPDMTDPFACRRFAPRKHRARMLAAVFFMQPVGQLLANVVAIIATALSHRYISQDSDPANCVGDCMETTDKIWRWIVGLGAVPPAIALLARLFIPESPRYTLEVEKDSSTAQQDANAYFPDPFVLPNQDDRDSHQSEDEPTDSREAGDDELAAEDGPIPMESLPSRQEGRGDGTSMDMATDDTIAPPPGNPNLIGVCPSPSSPEPNEPSHNDNGGHDPSKHPHGNTKTRKASWREFFNGFHDFLFKDSTNDPEPEGQMDLYPSPEQNVHADARGSAEPARRWTDGNWTDLAGTALSWFWLDFSFFFLGVNSWKIISNIWATPSYPSVYQLLVQYSWRALISVSISSIIGGAIFIKMAKYRHSIQTYGFLIEAAFLVAVGVTFVTLLSGRYFAATIVLYFFSQLFFDLGKNAPNPFFVGRWRVAYFDFQVPTQALS
jgi:MFS transporter, PHS family, inorganic phosphate transporter